MDANPHRFASPDAVDPPMTLTIDNEPFHVLPYVTSGPRGVPRVCTLPFHRGVAPAGALGGRQWVLTGDLQGRERAPPDTGRLLGLVVAEELELLAELGEADAPARSVVVLAGDLYDRPDLGKRGGTGYVDDVWRAFQTRFSDVVGVLGNHDLLRAPHEGLLDGDVREVVGVRVGGVSGIVGRPSRPNRSTEAAFSQRLRKVLDRRPDLVVTHLGPDEPQHGWLGSPAVRDVLVAHPHGAPLVFGHCHWPVACTRVNERDLVNVDGRVVILTERG